MLIVGSRQERGVTRTVSLALAKDRATIYLHLGEGLLQLALLRRSHVSQLIYIDKEIMGERHLRVKLIAKIDMIEEVASQLLWQETIGKGTLATTLLTNENRCHLIAMEHI